MEDKKTKVALVIFIIIIILIILFPIFNGKFKKPSSGQYLIIKDYLIWQKDGNKWNQIENFNDDVLKQKYTIYGDTKKSNLKLQYDNNKLYFFDSNYKEETVKNMRAATSNFDIKLADYEVLPSEEEDIEYINEALKLINAGRISEYITTKYIGDFDNNGEEETLYVSSNYVFDNVSYVMYSVLFTVDDEKNVQIIDKSKNTVLSIEEILDIDNDGKYEVITAQGYVNLPALDTCYKLYKLEDGVWVNKKECKNKSNI